jgi:D-3-phosphoglycerate dehydrogenase
MKKGVTIVNVARGPIVVEKDLLEALESGHVGCAALDVFDEEPPPKDNPLVLSEKTICTPHLGASTKEAQDKVAIDIANQIVDYFKNGVIKNSVNAPSVSFEVAKQITPYLKLSEKLGTVVSRITDFPIKEVTIQYMGEIATAETKILTQGIVKSILQEQMEGVNYVNAPVVAKSRAVKIKEMKTGEGGDFTSLLVITVKGETGENTVQGTLFGKKEPRLIKVNNIYLEADLRGHMLFVYNYDRPGVIASIANVFFIRGINIGGMHFGRESVGGLAISLLDLDKEIEDNVIREIQSLPNIVTIKKIELP